MTRRYAAIDAGTNTMRLLISQADESLVDCVRLVEYARLGEGVDRYHRFTDEAIYRAEKIAEKYAAEIEKYGCDKVRFIATSASRDAANRDLLFEKMHRILGVLPEVIDGETEASLSYRGALSGIDDLGSRILVVDSGGGSTELVSGDRNQISKAVSLDIGSRRLSERFMVDDPPSRQQVKQAQEYIDSLLDTLPFDLGEIDHFIAVAGTATTMAALMAECDRYERERIHASIHSAAQIKQLTEKLCQLSHAQIAALGQIARPRADVLAAGALILSRICARVSVSMQVSECDILDGVVLSLIP